MINNSINSSFKKEFLKEFEVEAKKEVIPFAKTFIDQLKENTPILTGAARDSWELKRSPLQIVSDSDYMKELNAGSSKQAPSNFIESTLLSNPAVSANGNIVSYS